MSKPSTRTKLSFLWIVVLINMLFADVFSIMIELVNHNTLNIPGDVKTIMAIAALITNIPIAMIFLSQILPPKPNRIANSIVAIFTIVYVVGGGDAAPHYIIIASIEVLVLVVIIINAAKWKSE